MDRSIIPITGLATAPSDNYGVVFADSSDRFYISNNDGGLYLIENYTTATPSATFLSNTQNVIRNDGFACALASSAMDRDNDNNLDPLDLDLDGDGLTNIDESPSNPYVDGDSDLVFAYLDDDAMAAIGNINGTVEVAFDTDGDGIPDFFDLDSDNDGIYDVVEAGHGLTQTNGRITGQDTGSVANGLFDGVETPVDSGTINYTITDTDMADEQDFQSADSDGDSCPDALEGTDSFIVGDLDGDNSLGDIVNKDREPTVTGSPQNITAAVTDAGDNNICGPVSSLTPFSCPSTLYQIIAGELKSYNPITGEYSAPIATTNLYNAMGYNHIDDYVYAIGKGGGASPINRHLIRVRADGVIEDLGLISGFTSGGISGDVDDSDNLWINIGDEYHRIENLSSQTVGGTLVLVPRIFTGLGGSTLPTGNMNDVVFINGSIYGVNNNGEINIWNLTTLEKSLVEGLTTPTATNFGAAFMDAEDRLYVSYNDSGLYLINDYTTVTPSEALLNNTAITTSNDGFACPLAPSVIDNDFILDSLDLDVDGILTVDENPDPNGNGIPDYLEPNVPPTGGEDGITIFTGISPKGDGVHDVFIISGIERLENKFEIYNRCGVKVYEAKDHGRDDKFFRGISNGRTTIENTDELPVGTYYYVLEYVLESGERKNRAGYLYINKESIKTKLPRYVLPMGPN